MPLQAALAIPMGFGLAKTIFGGFQALTAKRPSQRMYNIPKEVAEMVDIFRDRTYTPMPEKQGMLDRQDATMAKTLTGVKESATGGSLLGATAGIAEGIMSGARDIDLMEAEMKRYAEQAYAQSLEKKAEYQDRKWDVNVREPWLMDMNEYYNRKYAGQSNLFQGLSDITKLGMSHYNNESLDKLFTQLFGGET